jgi:hypothetical protein
MSWQSHLYESLEAGPICGYYPDQTAFTEPTALTALALLAAGRKESAMRSIQWLSEQQRPDGSLGAGPEGTAPKWPTSMAILAWSAFAPHEPGLHSRIEAAVSWICGQVSWSTDTPASSGHDTQLVAWPWVNGTHAWVEPTAFHVLGLKTAGRRQHPRVREAITLLLDRQLPQGGCNYGNTLVLGTTLRPHPQPTGVAILALADELGARDAITGSMAYLRRAIGPDATTVSLCWSLMGSSACGERPGAADAWLERAFRRVQQQDRSPYKYALIALATQAEKCPLVTLPRGEGVLEHGPVAGN